MAAGGLRGRVENEKLADAMVEIIMSRHHIFRIIFEEAKKTKQFQIKFLF